MGLAVRASQMPLLAKCAASAWAEGVNIDEFNPAAEVGTTVHELLAEYVSTGKVDADRLNDLSDEERMLFFAGRKAWNEVKDAFPEPQVEVALKMGVPTGHPDVLSIVKDESGNPLMVRVLDWKTTRLEDVDYHDQMMCLLFLAWFEPLGGDTRTQFQYTIRYLRDGTVDTPPTYTVEDLLDWYNTTVVPILEWEGRGKVYRPGPHCAHCPIFHTCDARAAIAESAAVLVKTDALPVPERIVETYRQLSVLEKSVKSFKDMIRIEVEKAGGALLGDGYDLRLVPTIRETIDVAAGWQVLRENLPDHELAQCLTIRKGKNTSGEPGVLDFIADKAPRGGKKATKDTFMEALRSAGAVKENGSKALRVFKVKGGHTNDKHPGKASIGTGGAGSGKASTGEQDTAEVDGKPERAGALDKPAS